MCCCSFVGQLLFGAIMLVALGLTLASMFSPGWTELKNTTNIEHDLLHFKFPLTNGIFPFLCRLPSEDEPSDEVTATTSASSGNDFNYCVDFWNRLPTWEKVVVATMCLALIVEVIALIWTIISICACCCKQCCVFLLPILALIASLLLAIAVIVFGINNKNFINQDFDKAIKVISEVAKSEVGYSFYLACGALAATVVDIIIGALAQTLAKHCL
uniref:Uncharacterized protein n=2 Tax=Parascaris univalens TaxID=6257 RepID=A0A915BZH2_PARUN